MWNPLTSCCWVWVKVLRHFLIPRNRQLSCGPFNGAFILEGSASEVGRSAVSRVRWCACSSRREKERANVTDSWLRRLPAARDSTLLEAEAPAVPPPAPPVSLPAGGGCSAPPPAVGSQDFPLRHPAGMLRCEPGAAPRLCPLELAHLPGLNTRCHPLLRCAVASSSLILRLWVVWLPDCWFYSRADLWMSRDPPGEKVLWARGGQDGGGRSGWRIRARRD